MGRRVLVGAAGTGAALALWAIVRLIGCTAFVAHAPWIDALCALAILLGCVFLCTCWYLDLRWLLCAVCLFGVLFLQNLELDQQALHQHGRTEHVRVRQIQWSAGGGTGASVHRYTVTVIDGPPLAPIEENGLMGWKWVVGGTYTVTVDPQGRAPLRRGDKPGPPVIQQFLQIPLVLGLAFALWRPAGRLLRRQGVPSAGPAQP
ncbi:hypothetical protein OOK58_02445 [Streptomyces sp. NBC_01728]|uniref:hypothetical protein n=1 Tax=unclassified Streptomyces TaxID=2593676 RepID=UPI00224EB1C8|nr:MULTISPECIES: hypothetical protein [unclassified Streptomyces]MCX4461539.1 hypothetical protein [Streptomyces sp. NBC_01719]MCX4490446.1 hypothetical protein [Streptomyces sp. NBC_01728]